MRSSRCVRRAENLTKARPHVLTVASAVGLSVIRSQSTQQKVGSGGATHEEEKVSCLGIVHPRDELEENLLLFAGLAQPGVTTPHHSVWLHRWSIPGSEPPCRSAPCPLFSTLASSHDASEFVHGSTAPPQRQHVPHPLSHCRTPCTCRPNERTHLRQHPISSSLGGFFLLNFGVLKLRDPGASHDSPRSPNVHI